jgi:sec-independent protein translocase protein TatC
MALKMKLPDNPNNISMSLGDHLEELRARLIFAIIGLVIALILCMCFGKWIILFIEKPYIDVMGKDARLQSLAPMDGFMSYMNVAMIAAVVISSPWIFYQIWQFIAAGLYPKERKYVHLAVPFSAGLFITGALFFIFIIATQTLRFLITFNRSVIGVDSNFTFTEYVSFISLMMLVFGLAFQTPIAIFFLYKTGLVSIHSFCKSRRYVMFAIVVIAACATPGSDPVSLFALAIPMYLLFELGILLSWLSEKKSAKLRQVSIKQAYNDG